MAARDMIGEAGSALVVFVLLCASAGLGRYIRPRLPEDHRKHDTVEAMQLMIGMLVTFTALVLGLLTASVETAYDDAGHDLQDYALQLTQLDQCLRNYGPGTEAARSLLAGYTAAVIASTWTSESPPAGVVGATVAGIPQVGPSATLAAHLNGVYLEVRRLQPANVFQTGVRDDCVSDYRGVIKARQAAIEDDRSPISVPLYLILVFWLMVIFAAFGLVAPRNGLALIGIGLSAVSLSVAIFVISALSHPYFVAFPSADMRDALAHMVAVTP